MSNAEALVFRGRFWSACSIQGVGRERNADALAYDLRGACFAFAVADGVGDRPASPLASTAAVNAAVGWLGRQPAPDADASPALYAAINRDVSRALRYGALEGSTTLVTAAILGGRAVLTSIGDSEALIVPPAEPAVRLNPLDHVRDRPYILTGWIDGSTEFEPHTVTLGPLGGVLCLMTDGVTAGLNYVAIARLIQTTPLPDAAEVLCRAAQAVGSTDDVTAIIIGEAVEEDERVSYASVR